MTARTTFALVLAFSLSWLGCGGSSNPSPDGGTATDAGVHEDDDAGFTDAGVDGGPADGGDEDAGMAEPGAALAVGWRHVCQLRSGGAAVCWGDNAEGELGVGDNTAVAIAAPTPVAGGHEFVHLSANAATTCAIDSHSALYCWGKGTAAPARIDSANDWATVGAGDAFSCALKRDGSLYCFDTSTGIPTEEPARLGQDTFRSLSVGFDHACAIRSDRLMFCWGSNLTNQLGFDTAGEGREVPVHVGDDTDWATVAAGPGRTLATRTDGSLWCWGDNANGACTTFLAPLLHIPTQIGFDPDWATVTTGRFHTCAQKVDGALYCWGDNAYGEIGTGSISPRIVPSPTRIGAGTWTVAAAGNSVTCGLRDSGELDCWGSNAAGAVGLGTVSEKSAPTQTTGAPTALSVYANNGTTCSRTKDGKMSCWGFDRNGEAGVGSVEDLQMPQDVNGTWKSVALGLGHTVAVSWDGTLWGWGSPSNGDMLSVTSPTSSPTMLDSTSQWNLAVAGVGFTCATKNTGGLFCFGLNARGALGDGTTTDRTTPTQAGMIVDWTQLSAGPFSVCGVRANGELHCWGDDSDGQLGLGTSGDVVTSPTQVGTATDWALVSMGGRHTCGVRTSGALYCWGQNLTGQLGLGTTSEHETTPMQVGSDTDWSTVSAGRTGTCAVKQNGTLWCWGGSTQFHETVLLSDGTFPSSPTQVGSASDWSEVDIDDSHSCATKTTGEVYCWGGNQFGQLGQNDSWRAEPTKVE